MDTNQFDHRSPCPLPSKPLENFTDDELHQLAFSIQVWEKGSGSPKAILGDRYQEWELLDLEGDSEAIERLITADEYTSIYGRQPGQVFSKEVMKFITLKRTIPTMTKAELKGLLAEMSTDLYSPMNRAVMRLCNARLIDMTMPPLLLAVFISIAGIVALVVLWVVFR